MGFKEHEEIDRRFTFHAMTIAEEDQYRGLLNLAQDLAYQITDICPEGRERSQATTDLDNCLLHVRAAIERE